MARIKLFLIPVVAVLLVGIVFATQGIYSSSTPSIFNKDSQSLQQPVRYGQYRYTHYDPRVINYYRLDVNVPLDPVEGGDFKTFKRGMNHKFPAGSAHIRSSRSKALPNSHIFLTVKDVGDSSRTGLAYEAWLFDEQSGYALSIGCFSTIAFGNGAVEWRTKQYVDEYDYVFVTEEPIQDNDPRPGPVVLQGRIPKPNYFYEREFAPVKKTFGYTLT